MTSIQKGCRTRNRRSLSISSALTEIKKKYMRMPKCTLYFPAVTMARLRMQPDLVQGLFLRGLLFDNTCSKYLFTQDSGVLNIDKTNRTIYYLRIDMDLKKITLQRILERKLTMLVTETNPAFDTLETYGTRSNPLYIVKIYLKQMVNTYR